MTTKNPKKAPDPKRSEAAKKAVETRRANEMAAHQANEERDKWAIWDKRIRDGFIFIFGIGFSINELIFVKPDPRPAALIFAANMIGVPLILAAAERKRQG